MEVIKIQTARSNIAAKLLDFITECKKCNGMLEARVFRQAKVGDFSLCLLWSTDQPELQGSSVGLHLSNILKKDGLVNHSVWVETIEHEEKVS
ncbi:MAG: hypothetical protein HKP41_01930 [Desulfobacterales bacterium]|nr:hypothetical protein [Desulfobacterales bacterium]